MKYFFEGLSVGIPVGGLLCYLFASKIIAKAHSAIAHLEAATEKVKSLL